MTPHPSFAPLRQAQWLWLAVLLALCGALLPSVSHALGGNKASGAVEVCTSTGMAWVDVHGPGTNDAVQPMDCPWCLLSAASALPAPVAVAALPVVAAAHPAPRARLPFLRQAFAALAPPPRGPPAVS